MLRQHARLRRLRRAGKLLRQTALSLGNRPMLNILLVSPRQDRFEALQTEMASLHPTDFTNARDGRRAVARVRKQAVDLVVVDEDLGDMSGLELVRRLLKVNAMVNTAVVSTDSHQDFHEHSEGLGVLLQLPAVCGRHEAVLLIDCVGRLGLVAKP